MHTLQVYNTDDVEKISVLVVEFETEMLSTIHSLLYQNYDWLLYKNYDIFIDDNYQDQYEGVLENE